MPYQTKTELASYNLPGGYTRATKNDTMLMHIVILCQGLQDYVLICDFNSFSPLQIKFKAWI